MKKITNIVILAGGDGDRFWPLKEKLLTPFLGKPLLMHLIDGTSGYGERIYVVCSTENASFIKNMVKEKATLIFQDKNKEGMAGAVLSCKGKVTGDTLILGNDLFDFDAINKLCKKMESDKELIFIAKKVSEYFPGGYLQLDNGRLTGIVEKPAPDKVPSDFTRFVADYFRDIGQLIARLERITSDYDDLYERAMDVFIKDGKADFVAYEGEWTALKYSWHVLDMMRQFLAAINKPQIDPTAVVSKTALIDGNVVLGKNVKVGDYVKIAGPCFIGDNTIIADYSLVRESHIGNNCLVGSSCEVARSYLGDGVSLHRNYVGDSVLAEKVLFGAGSVTANFRFDQGEVHSLVKGKKINTKKGKLGAVIGASSKIGVNSTLFPGVKIGEDTRVAPGEVVAKDLDSGVFFSKGEVKTMKL